MHSMRATLTTHGHTPYTCVYTPIYPVFYTAYPGTGRITRLDTSPKNNIRIATDTNLNHIAKRRPIYTSYRTPTAIPLPTCVCLYQYVKYRVSLVLVQLRHEKANTCNHNAPIYRDIGANDTICHF
nr:MAG TPA: hypothetical protein [Bacteriophage sp.]